MAVSIKEIKACFNSKELPGYLLDKKEKLHFLETGISWKASKWQTGYKLIISTQMNFSSGCNATLEACRKITSLQVRWMKGHPSGWRRESAK